MTAGAETLERVSSASGAAEQASPPERLARWAWRVPWLWPALLTVLICGYRLGTPQLWRDELYSWTFAADPVHDTISNTVATNPAQLTYFVFLHYWIAAFGDSVISMRVPSVLCMAGAAAVVTLIGRRLGGTRTGLAAGIVFALVPSVARFGQEVRYYAPQVLVAAVALLFLLRALDRPSSQGWALYTVSLVVCGYVDIVAMSMLAGHAGVVGLRCWLDRRDGQPRAALRRAAGFVLAVTAGVAACGPVIVSSLAKASSQVGWLPKPAADLATFSDFGRNLFFSTSVAAIVLMLAVLAWLAWRPAALLTAMALLPVAAVWLVSQGSESYFFPRYLQFTVVAWAVLAGLGLSRLDRRVLAAALMLVAICAAGDQRVLREAGSHNWAEYPVGNAAGHYTDYADAAGYIGRGLKPGDGVAYPSGKHFWAWTGWQLIGPGVQYYLRRDLPSGVPMPHEEFVVRPGTQFGELRPSWCRNAAACLGSQPRIWVIGAGGGLRKPAQALLPGQAAVLTKHYQVTGVRHLPGVTVFLLTRDR